MPTRDLKVVVRRIHLLEHKGWTEFGWDMLRLKCFLGHYPLTSTHKTQPKLELLLFNFVRRLHKVWNLVGVDSAALKVENQSLFRMPFQESKRLPLHLLILKQLKNTLQITGFWGLLDLKPLLRLDDISSHVAETIQPPTRPVTSIGS